MGEKGHATRQPKDQRYENAYVFGAVCPSRDTGIAIIMPYANTAAMRKHIEAISRAVAPGAHGLVILDQAGWHTTRKLKVPKNLTLMSLPPACPELNAVENFPRIWHRRRESGQSLSRKICSRLQKCPRGLWPRPTFSRQELAPRTGAGRFMRQPPLQQAVMSTGSKRP